MLKFQLPATLSLSKNINNLERAQSILRKSDTVIVPKENNLTS
jgi:hypothetical protein